MVSFPRGSGSPHPIGTQPGRACPSTGCQLCHGQPLGEWKDDTLEAGEKAVRELLSGDDRERKALAVKTNLLRKLSGQMEIPLTNLSLSFSQKLLPLTARERKLRCLEIISELIDAQGAPRLAVDNTEIIFEPSLMLNPQGLLQSLPRTHLLIWAWNREVENDDVTYAYPGHSGAHPLIL